MNDSFNERTYHLKHNVSREANLNPVSVSLLMLGNREEVDPAKIIRFHAKATIAVCYNTSNVRLCYSLWNLFENIRNYYGAKAMHCKSIDIRGVLILRNFGGQESTKNSLP